MYRARDETDQGPMQVIAAPQPTVEGPSRGRPKAQRSLPLTPTILARLAAREREIATIVYSRGEMSADEVRAAAGAELSNSAVRTMLGRLAGKGVIRRRKNGNKFLYSPSVPDELARKAALHRVSQDYFGGSLFDAALALMELVAQRQPGAVRSISRRVRRHSARPASPAPAAPRHCETA